MPSTLAIHTADLWHASNGADASFVTVATAFGAALDPGLSHRVVGVTDRLGLEPSSW